MFNQGIRLEISKPLRDPKCLAERDGECLSMLALVSGFMPNVAVLNLIDNSPERILSLSIMPCILYCQQLISLCCPKIMMRSPLI
jgi:hypothetical protein